MKTENGTQKPKKPTWVRSGTNLYRYSPTGTFYARARVGGKIIPRSLKTDKITKARERLRDFLKQQRRRVESLKNLAKGKMLGSDAIRILKERLESNRSLKPRAKEYRLFRLKALLASWRNFEKQDVSEISRNDCLQWAGQFGSKKKISATAFNNTVGTLRMLLDIAIEFGARYDNPAKLIDKHRIRVKAPELPSQEEFHALLAEIEAIRFGRVKPCADLVRFLAYGGFRKGEAANITWADCDFTKQTIRVRGDAETGTKNWTERRVPMIREMEELLKRLRSERPEAKANESVMLVKECQGAINRACEELHIARFTHHDLRHLFATRCIESGIDIPTVSRWLGHKDGGALLMKTYGHLRDEHSVNMAKKVSFGSRSNGEPLKESVNVLSGNENAPKAVNSSQVSTNDLPSD
jgi:integrase